MHNRREKIPDFLLRLVVGVASGLDRVNARPVLVPLVFPETLVVAVHVYPVLVHVREQVVPTLRRQDRGDVAVFPGGVAELAVASVAVVRPVG